MEIHSEGGNIRITKSPPPLPVATSLEIPESVLPVVSTTAATVTTTTTTTSIPVQTTVTSPSDKKAFSLLYVQPPKSPTTSAESVVTVSKPLTAASPVTTTTTTNGLSGKVVAVTPPSQSNIAYVGTLFKAGIKGKDCISQKVLLTPLKAKDGAVARLLLPSRRPPPPTTTCASGVNVVLTQGNVVSKSLCKSYVVSPMVTTAKGASLLGHNTVVVDSQANSVRTYTPNIIRQKPTEKLTTTSVLKQFCQIAPAASFPSVTSSNAPTVISIAPSSRFESVSNLVSAASSQGSNKIPIPKLITHTKLCNSSSLLISNNNSPKLTLSSLPPPKPSLIPVTQPATLTLISPTSSTNSLPSSVLELMNNSNSVLDSLKKTTNKEVDPVILLNDKTKLPRDDSAGIEEGSETTVRDSVNSLDKENENGAKPRGEVENSESSTKDNYSSLLCSDIVTIDDDSEPEDFTEVSSSQGSLADTISSKVSKTLINSSVEPEPVNSHNERAELNSVLNAPPANPERSQKRKPQLLVSNPKRPLLPKQMDDFKMLPGAENFDPFKVIEWEASGIGKLPSSEIKFFVNDFGMLELLDSKYPSVNKHGFTDAYLEEYSFQRREHDSDDIFCCIACGCYGLLTEFYNENCCSTTCRDELIARQDAIFRKRELEIEKETFAKKKRKLLFIGGKRKADDELDIDESPVLKLKPMESLIKKADEKVSREVIELEDNSNDMTVSSESNNSKPNNSEEPSENVKPKFQMRKRLKLEKPMKSSDSITSNESNSEKKCKFNLRSRDQDKLPSTCNDSEDEKEREEEKNFDKLFLHKDEEFPWGIYLNATQCKAAWLKLFSTPFPSSGNAFKKGQKLEAIDPEHQSYFCVVTVNEVQGYRINLHFDGYDEKFNFWVNVDSPNIFPSGFSAKHGIQLQTPLGYDVTPFSWPAYNAFCKSRSAPLHCFPNYRSTNTAPNLFAVGMKLEAVDRRNSFLVCVATVAAVMDDRILVHFDSWGDMYDYWADTSSPYIHPVGWCAENNHHLTPPLGYRDTEFSWDSYLKEKKAVAAPTRAFRLRPHIEFKKSTKIEAVDKRAPHLLRVASIKEVLPYQVKICFDGFPDHFGYWVDDDSSDIHPIGWGAKTGHPVEPPPKDDLSSPCPTPGCIGQGHVEPQLYREHSSAKDCPYSIDNMSNEHLLVDRFARKDEDSEKENKNDDELVDLDKDDDSSDFDGDIRQIRWKWLEMKQMIAQNKKGPKKVCQDVARKKHKRNLCISNPLAELEQIVSEETDPTLWDPQKVTEFANKICLSKTSVFIDEEIDGEALLMMCQQDLKEALSLKWGDIIKLYECILLLREKVSK